MCALLSSCRMVLQTHFRISQQLTWQLHRFLASRGQGIHTSLTALQKQLLIRSNHYHLHAQFRVCSPRSCFPQSCREQPRYISSNIAKTEYRLEVSGLQQESFHARDMYKVAVNSVEPRPMVEKVLQFDEVNSLLTVNESIYKVDHNVYVVGFGKAVLGMARAVEDVLGEHIVSGILSIPTDQRKILGEKGKSDLLLLPESKIQVHEGGHNHLPDMSAHKAALAIEDLLKARGEKDLVIVLVSGGGSPLLPTPLDPITLNDLTALTELVHRSGVPIKDLNIIRKKLERLKGGKMVNIAHPAKMISLILSDIIGDPLPMIAGGPTVHDEVTAHQCYEILIRFDLLHKMPGSIRTFLEKQVAEESARIIPRKPPGGGVLAEGSRVRSALHAEFVQNVLVGSNTMACEAAMERAKELGHLPYLLSTHMEGEARQMGAKLAKLGMFTLMCFDRKLSSQLSMLKLELDIIQDGISKKQVNEIIRLVETATNMGCNVALISGGGSVVTVEGDGKGGRNLEVSLGAALQLQKLFNLSKPRASADITLLSADTDGYDGPDCPVAGAVVDENFVIEAEMQGLSCQEYLNRNDSYGLFSLVKGGSNLVVMHMTGTNVMDVQVLIVRNPRLRPK